MKEFTVEIRSCENGFIVSDGTSTEFQGMLRRRWIAANSNELADLIKTLSSPTLHIKDANVALEAMRTMNSKAINKD